MNKMYPSCSGFQDLVMAIASAVFGYFEENGISKNLFEA
jgi:hypothetical protein